MATTTTRTRSTRTLAARVAEISDTVAAQRVVEEQRTALFRREAAGQAVTEAEWDAVADAQRVLNGRTFGPDGYVRHDYHS